MASACQLTFATPLIEPHFWESQNQYQGIAVDFLNLLAAKSGCAISYQAKPWKRVMHEMQQGKVDLTIGFYAANRESFARYSHSEFGEYAFYLFTRADVEPVTDIKTLFTEKKRVLFLKNWFLGKLKPEIESEPKFAMPIDSIKQGIKLLLNDRAYAMLSPKTNALYSFKKMRVTEQIIINSDKLEALNQYLIFSKASVSDEVYQRLDSAMTQIIDSGEMQRILRSYTHLKP